MKKLLRLRRPVQIAALILLAAVPWLNRAGWTELRGGLFAFDAFGLPLADPLGALQLLANGVTPGARLLAGAFLALALAACLGRVFCGWLCPFGLLSELTQKLRRKRPRPRPRAGGFRSRALMLLAGLVLAALLGAPVLNQISLPGGLTVALQNPALPLAEAGPGKAEWSAPELAALYAAPFTLIMLALAGELALGRRLWCRWLCPQSVLLALAARLPFGLRLRRDLTRCVCGKKAACLAVCPLDLDPRSARSANPLECVNCGACVRACATAHGHAPAALHLGFASGKAARPDETSPGRKNA